MKAGLIIDKDRCFFCSLNKNMELDVATAFVNGINIEYDVSGQGEYLVLLVGLGGESRSLFRQVQEFKRFFQVVSFDNRGSGESDTPNESFSIRTMADDTVGLMDYLGIESAHILGVSMGGMIAQEIAISYPERVNKLVLASTYPGGEDMREITENMRKALGLGEDFSKDDAWDVDIEKFMNYVASLSFNKREYRMIFSAMSGAYVQKAGFEGFAGQLEAASNCDTHTRLHLIKSPTLVLTGTGDRVVPMCSSEMIAGKIPDARLVTIEDGSHAMYLEMSKSFNNAVMEYLMG